MDRANGLDTGDIWLGLLGPPEVGSWGTWDDGTTLAFSSAWGSLQPGGAGGCALAKGALSFGWSDESCTYSMENVICQRGTLVQFCPADWSLYSGDICYKHLGSSGPKEFPDAQADCVAAGGTLPSFHSDQEWLDFFTHK